MESSESSQQKLFLGGGGKGEALDCSSGVLSSSSNSLSGVVKTGGGVSVDLGGSVVGLVCNSKFMS